MRQNKNKKKQKQIFAFISGALEALFATAQKENAVMAARILYTAREDLAHWAVTMNFHETRADIFLDRLLREPAAIEPGEAEL